MSTTVQALKTAEGNKIYPKTIADAVAYDSTHTVKSMLSNGVYCEKVSTVQDSDFPINATTLNGHTSDYFAKASDISNLVKQISDGSGSDVSTISDDGTGNTLTDDEIYELVKDHNHSDMAHSSLFDNVTFYVDKSKSIVNVGDGLTEDTAFPYIGMAIDKIPKLAHSVKILVKSGTYQEDIIIKNKHTENITISAFSEDDDVQVDNIRIYYCKQVNLYGINVYNCYQFNEDGIHSSIDIRYSSCELSNCTLINCLPSKNVDDGSGVYGVYAISSHVVIWRCELSKYQYAIRNDYHTVHVADCTGDDNVYAYMNHDGIIVYNSRTNIKYTKLKVYGEYEGLTINHSAAKYLNMFSNATSDNAAQFHNNIYRGNDITSYLTDGSLFTRISSGTFDDLFIGDYFTMDELSVDGYTLISKKFVLCGFDTYIETGSESLSKHHAVVMPSNRLFSASMNATDTTNGGYYNSVMHKTIMPKIANGIKSVIGSDHLITYKDLLSDTTTNGKSSGWNWYDTTCRLCSEVDVYGFTMLGNVYDIGLGNRQLPIFKLYPKFYQSDDKYWMWLSTVTDDSGFASCASTGFSDFQYKSSNNIGGVRPRFLIG